MRKIWVLIFICGFSLAACGGRTPSDVKTSNLTKSYFHKYGKKYKETVFHESQVEMVDVKQTQELQKDVAASFVLIKMQNGTEVPVLLTMIRKFPLGWRISGWEWIRQ